MDEPSFCLLLIIQNGIAISAVALALWTFTESKPKTKWTIIILFILIFNIGKYYELSPLLTKKQYFLDILSTATNDCPDCINTAIFKKAQQLKEQKQLENNSEKPESPSAIVGDDLGVKKQK